MKSGKKLDDEISKIELKIQQFEDEKRKLNIDFKPYSYSNTKSSANLTKRSYTIDKNPRAYPRAETLQTLENAKKVEEPRRSGGYYLEKKTEEKYAGRISF